MFTVKRQLRFDGVSKKYLVDCAPYYGKRYAVIESSDDLEKGQKLSSAILVGHGNNLDYLLKKFD